MHPVRGRSYGAPARGEGGRRPAQGRDRSLRVVTPPKPPPPPIQIDRDITITEGITVKDLSEKLGLKARDLIRRLLATLGHALLREDAGFHEFQIYEAATRQYGNFVGRPEGDDILVGAARFLTAHAPTVRAVGQTFDIAARLNRGEALHDDVGPSAVSTGG